MKVLKTMYRRRFCFECSIHYQGGGFVTVHYKSAFMLQPRQNLLSAASKIGEASTDIMKRVGDEDVVDARFEVRTDHFIQICLDRIEP